MAADVFLIEQLDCQRGQIVFIPILLPLLARPDLSNLVDDFPCRCPLDYLGMPRVTMMVRL